MTTHDPIVQPVVPWPTIADAVDWIEESGVGPSAINHGQLQIALDAAVGHVAGRTQHSVDAPVPAPLRQAVLLYTAKWYRRQASPDGIAGNTDAGTVVRVGRWDSDAEALMAPWRWVPHA